MVTIDSRAKEAAAGCRTSLERLQRNPTLDRWRIRPLHDQMDQELSDASLLMRILQTTHIALARSAPPEPDVCASTDAGDIGIELTHLVLSADIARREGEQQRVMENARRAFDAHSSERVDVRAAWADDIEFKKANRPALVGRLLAEVRDLVGEPGEVVTRCAFPQIAPPPKDPAFEYIEVVRDDTLVESGFGLSLGWSPSARGILFLQDQIERKHSKPKNYRRSYRECWLVLVHGGHSEAMSVVLQEPVWAHHFETPYQRAFILFRDESKVSELKVRPLDMPV